MLATDKVHKDSDQRKKGKDIPKPNSLASWNDQIFKDRLQRFKKASGQTVPAQRVKKVKSKVTSGNKSNSSDSGNIQKTSTYKYSTQRHLTEKGDIQRSLTDKCDITRTSTDDDNTAKHGVQGSVFVCSQAAEYRRQLQNSHNRQRLLATLAFAEREKKEEECGYRLSSNGVLVSTRKTDIYKNVNIFPQNTEDEKPRAVPDSDDSTDECKTNTSDEVEDDGNDDFDTDCNEKLINDSLDSHCKEIYSKDYKYNGCNKVNKLPEGNTCTDEKCSKEISGSKLKVRYIFDSAELECYDYCFGKNSFVPTDYVGNYKVQRVQSPQLTRCNTESVRKTQVDTKKAIIVPDVVTSEDNVTCAPREEKTQATRQEWLEGVQERIASVNGQQDIRSVNQSSENKTGPSFKCRLERKHEQSICASQEDKANKVATCFLEMHDTRLDTEAMKSEVSENGAFVLEHRVRKSVLESIKCEDDSDIACEKNHENAVKDNQELRSGNPELINTLQSQNGGEECREIEHGISSEKYGKENIAYILQSKEVSNEIQEMNSTHKSQLNDKKKQEIGSVLPPHDNTCTVRKLTNGCSLLSHDVFEDPQKAECNSDLQEDTVSIQGMRFVLDNSDDAVGNISPGSDISGMKFTLMPNHIGGENLGAGCVSQQHKGFKDIDKECLSRQQGDFEDNDDECVPRQHWGFEHNDVKCVSRQDGNFEDNGVQCVSRQPGNFEDTGVVGVSQPRAVFEDTGVECVSRQDGNFEDTGVECVSRQDGNFEDTSVECVSRQDGNFEDTDVVGVSQPRGVFEDNNVEFVSRQHEGLEDNDNEGSSSQQGGFEDTGVECLSRHQMDFEDNNSYCVSRPYGGVVDNDYEDVGSFKNSDFRSVSKQHSGFKHNDVGSDSQQYGGFKHSDVVIVSRQHGGFELSDTEKVPTQHRDFKHNDVGSVSSQQCDLDNNDSECLDRQYGGVEGNDNVELVTGLQGCVEKCQNIECVSRPRMKFEEGHRQCHNKNEKRETESDLHKDMESDTKMGAEHEKVNHEMAEKSADRNKDIHSSRETKCLQSKVVAADAGDLVIHVQERSVEQEQYSHDGNISPVSCNEEHEIASEDDTSKRDLARELVCCYEFRSGDRKYASPYSKFQQCHEDLLKRLTNQCDDTFECENGDYLGECEYKCSEHSEKETIDETDEETDKDIGEDPSYDVQPKKLNAPVPEYDADGCDIVHSDTIQKQNQYVGAHKCNVLIQSIACCENKLEDQCYVTNRCVRRHEVEDKVQASYRKISSSVDYIEENANQDLHIHRTKEGNTDYTQEKIFREIHVMNCNEETLSPISSTTSCSMETLKLQVVKNHESRASSASTAYRSHSCLAHHDTKGEADDNGLEDHLIASKVERSDQFVQRQQQDNCVNKDEKSAPVLNKLQNEVDTGHIDREKNSTLVSSPKDNNAQDCLKYRTTESSRASASILEETSSDSISPQHSTVNSRNESTKQRTSQASSRSKCHSRNNKHSISDVSQKYSTDMGIAPLFNCKVNVDDTDGSISPTPCIVQHSGKVYATSPDRCGSVCNSVQLSELQMSVPVRHKEGIYLNNAEYFPQCNEYSTTCESDYNKQDNGINLQAGSVNFTIEKLVDKPSMFKLTTVQEPDHTSINHIHDTEQIHLARNHAFISSLKENDTEDLVHSVAKEVNPGSRVKENCIVSTTVSKTATESFTELDISCSSDCALGSDPASREVQNDAGCVNSQANTTVSSAPRNDIIEGITGINRAVLCDADMRGHGISEESKYNQSGHRSGESEITKNSFSVSKLSSHQAISNMAIYGQGGSGNDHYKNEIITTTKHYQSLKIIKSKEEECLDQETSKEDMNEHDLDFLHQTLERLPTIAASGDFTTLSKPTKNNDKDRRLSELLSVQRQTCGIMMKNVLRRADKSKNLYKTTKTKPTDPAENRSQSPLFCMVTGSKIEACIKQAPSKAIHRSNTHIACRGHKPMQQRQNEQAELDGRHRTMSNSSNLSQLPENRTTRPKTYKIWSSKEYTERSKPVNNVNANDDKSKSTKPLLQSKQNVRNLITDQTVQESKLTQENINDKQSFTKPTAGQERDSKYSGQCKDKPTFSKIPRLVKPFLFSETKHKQGNKNTNYSEVSENSEQPNSEACDLSQSLTQHSQSVSRAPKGNSIYTDSHHDELIFTDARDVYLETLDLGKNPKGINFQETRRILAEDNDDIVTQPSSNENEPLQGLDSEHDVHQTNEFEEKSAGNYLNNDSVTHAHTKECVLILGQTRNLPHKTSPQLWEENCHCHILKTHFNQKDLSQIQPSCFETDRSVSATQCFIMQSHQMLCEEDTPVSVIQCPITQTREILGETDKSVCVCHCSLAHPCEILCETGRSVSLKQHSITQQDEIHCETDRSVSVSQFPIIQPHEKLCETEKSIYVHQYPITLSHEMVCETYKSVSAHQSSKPVTKSINNAQVSDKSTHPTYNAQTKQTDHHEEHFDEGTHLSRRVSEQQCSSGRLPIIDNRQHLCGKHSTNEFVLPVTDVNNADIASADTPTLSDVHEECSTITKEDDQEMTTIATSTNPPWSITRNGAESTEYSRNSLNIRAISEEKYGDCAKECNTSEVDTCGIINSDKVRTRKHVYKPPLSDTASFRSMVKTLMNQSEDFASDSDKDSSPVNNRPKKKQLVFPVSPLENGISNFTKAGIDKTNYQTPTDVEKTACCEGGIDKPTYAELKARALAKALPVLSKLKVQSGKHMQIKPRAMQLPCDSVAERGVLKTSQIHPSVNATTLNYSTGIKAEILTNDCFEETDTGNSGTFMMNQSYYNCCSVFNINNSKSEQEIDIENDQTGPGQDYGQEKSSKFNIDKINLSQKDVVSVTTRGKANIHQSNNAGKSNVRRKCRIPVRQSRGPRVLLDEVEIPQDKHVKKPRDFVMVLKSKNKNKGSVAAALSLIQPAESSMLNTEDTKPITELPKHVQVFARGNGVVVEVCADSSSTAVSVSNIEQVKAPLAERIKKYQQERPRNILAGRNRTQDDSTASKRSKKISDNISSCSEVSSIASNLQVHDCEQASKSVNPCNRIDNIGERDTSTPQSSKTFKVSHDEDAVTDVKSNQKLLVRDGVPHEDIAIQTSDNTLASAVTVEKTHLTVQKKDAAEQVSMSSSNKSNSSAKELNENATVAQSKSLEENDSSYIESNSKSSEKQLVSGSLIKARTYLSEERKRYLRKNVAFNSKVPKTTSECTMNPKHNSATCVSKHAIHSRYQETLEKATKSDTTNSKRQQRYKRLERPVCVQQTTQNTSINLLSNCQLFSPSSQESNEPSLQQDPNSTQADQNIPYVNIQNIDIHQRHLSNSRNTDTVNDQDDYRQHTILTNSQSYRNATCPRLDGEEMRFDSNLGVALQNEEYRPSSRNTCTDKQKHFETRSSRNLWERDEDNPVSPEFIRPHSGSASHKSFHSSQWELHEIQKCNQTECAAGNETALPDTIEWNHRSRQSVDYAVLQPDSDIQGTRDVLLSLTHTSKLNLQECTHAEHIPDSGLTQIQLVNNGGVQREVSCQQVSIKTSETDCGQLNKSTKFRETDTYENLTLEGTRGNFCNISVTDCPSPIEGEAMKLNRPSSSESCHVLNKEPFANSSETVKQPDYKGILPSSLNKQKENIFSPIPATLSPTTSVKHPKTRSLLLKSMVFTAEDSSSKSSLRSNENANAHVYLATRRSDSSNPLSICRNGSPHCVAGNSNQTDDMCLCSGTLTCENRPAPGIEWQTNRSINPTSSIASDGEHNHVNLPQSDSEDMPGRSARINNKTPRLSHPKNCFSVCLQSQTPDRSTRTVTNLETLKTSSEIVNENWQTENAETLNAKQLSSFLGKCDDKEKITEVISSNYKPDSGNKTSNTLEVVPLRTNLSTRQSLIPAPHSQQAMTTPRKGKLTLTSLEMTDYEGLSPEVVNSCGSLSYLTTSQESAAETCVYSSRARVPVLAGHLINSNDAQQMPCSSALSPRPKKSSRTSEEMQESVKPKLPPISPGQSGLTPLLSKPPGLRPLSSRQSGLPHRPQFKRYY